MDLQIIKIASDNKNQKILKKYTHEIKNKNSICGDEIKVYLIIQDNKILDFKYECESCIYCQASVSLLSKNAKNKSIEKVKKFTEQAINIFEKNLQSFDKELKEFNKIIKKNNISRKECVLLPFKTVAKALNYKL